ncbi:MAG: fadH [Caulobacter sp.]|nr:fadH [Caulobacter sp.]
MIALFPARPFAGGTALAVGAPLALTADIEAGGYAVTHVPALEDENTAGAALDLTPAASILLCGAASPADAAAADFAAWRAQAGPGYDGVFFCATEFARRRLAAKAGGCILVLVPAPDDRDPAAAAISHAVANLVRTLAVEWARDGIRINAISSALATPEQLSPLIAYLCSPHAAYVTGAVLTA